MFFYKRKFTSNPIKKCKKTQIASFFRIKVKDR